MAVKSLIYYILQAKLKKKWGKKANFENSHFERNINTIINPLLKIIICPLLISEMQK